MTTRRVDKAMKEVDARCIAETFVKDLNEEDQEGWVRIVRGDAKQNPTRKHEWSCTIGWIKNGEEQSNDLDSIVIVDARNRTAMFADEYFAQEFLEK